MPDTTPPAPLSTDNQNTAPLPSVARTQSGQAQPHNPLHGLTLEAMVTALVDYFGWEELGQRIPVRCFTHEPSLGSSLKFLRKTPWAREKVEGLTLYMLRQQEKIVQKNTKIANS